MRIIKTEEAIKTVRDLVDATVKYKKILQARPGITKTETTIHAAILHGFDVMINNYKNIELELRRLAEDNDTLDIEGFSSKLNTHKLFNDCPSIN